MTVRSYLYVPGDAPEMLAKAFDRGADALIVDLEDAVPMASKDSARRNVSRWLDDLSVDFRDSVWVRINAGSELEQDVNAVVRAGMAGVILPKATQVSMRRLDEALSDLESALRMDEPVRIAPLLETAVGILDLPAIAGHVRVHHLAMGESDLVAELGIERSRDDLELLPLRIQVVLASAAADLPPPVGSTSTDFRDLDDLRESTEALRRLGFRGRSAIHPAQIPVINDVFTPSEERVARARDVVRRYEEARGQGRGVATDEDGRMIDEAVVRRARSVLELASEN